MDGQALIWVYELREDSLQLASMVVVVVSGRHVCTVGINLSTNPWNTTVMSAAEDAHEPLTRHAARMEEHGYTLLIPPTAVALTTVEFEEMDPEDKVKKVLTLRIKRLIARTR